MTHGVESCRLAVDWSKALVQSIATWRGGGQLSYTS